MPRSTISCAIVVLNEERNIADCLETARWMDEIVVVDAYSRDNTVAICRQYTDRVFQRLAVAYVRVSSQYPFRDVDYCLAKMDRYTDLMAKRMVSEGRRFRAHQLVTHPSFTFFKMYVLRAGFLDGIHGAMLSGLYAYYTLIKYAKFWELTRT